MTAAVRLTNDRARRIALGAQGLTGQRPQGRIDRRHGRRVFDRVTLVQIDSVNVLCRSQELPLFARLGDHPRDLIPRMTAAGELFEFWGHEASHLPVRLHPLLRWRMDDARRGVNVWGHIARIAVERPALVQRVLDQVRDEGPITAGQIHDAGERGEHMWARTPGKAAIEHLFWTGRVTATRGPNFERLYDLPERVLPDEILGQATPSRHDAQKQLLLAAASSHGVGTAGDLADYFRLDRRTARTLLDELVGDQLLLPVEVDGWNQPAYLDPKARQPREPKGRALLSPFDSLVWERSRTERLFGFRYRLEIYVRRHERIHGYYVLPFLLDGRLVARVDLKADRSAGVLLVQAAFAEPDVDVDRVAHELRAELDGLRVFLGLDGLVIGLRGDLAPALTEAHARR